MLILIKIALFFSSHPPLNTESIRWWASCWCLMSVNTGMCSMHRFSILFCTFYYHIIRKFNQYTAYSKGWNVKHLETQWVRVRAKRKNLSGNNSSHALWNPSVFMIVQNGFMHCYSYCYCFHEIYNDLRLSQQLPIPILFALFTFTRY